MENKPKLLIIDNDKAILDSYSLLLKKYFEVETSDSIKDANKKLKKNGFKVAIIDMAFPDDPEGGLKIIEFIKNNKINTKTIVLTAYGSEDNFKKSYDEGIFDYVEKATPATNQILIHSAIYSASLPPEIRLFLTDENLDFFFNLETTLNLSKIEIIKEGLKLLNWAITEWKAGNDIVSLKGDKIKKIKNPYSNHK